MVPGSRRSVDPEGRLRLLSTLIDGLRSSWPEASGEGDASAMGAEFDRLLAWAERGGLELCADDEAGGADRFLQRRMLEALRIEAIRRWSEEGGTAEHYLGVLELLEARARVVLPKDARDVATRLSDPDGFELLVEVAHDLRSPLTSISFLAETLRSGFSGELNAQQAHQMGLIYSAALAMQSVVTDVMDLARHGSDVSDETPTAFSLSEAFDHVRRLVQPMAEIKGIELRVELPENDRVHGRPNLLSRILLNLVTNGLKFTAEGYVEMAATRVGREEVEISVRDTGRGIDPANQSTMFEAFRKSSDRPGSFFSGSGLGLAIVRRLVASLDSELRFETRKDWGTRFSFVVRLPVVPHY